MRRNNWKRIGVAVLAGVLAVALTYAAKTPKKVSLPAAVQKTLAEQYPAAAIKEVEEEKAGPIVYEVELTQADGSVLEVTVAADGTIIEVEHEIKPDTLPNAVLAALPQNAVIKEAQIQTIRAVFQPVVLAQSQMLYEVEVMLDGKEVEIEVTPEGKVIQKQIENDDDDGDDGDDEGDDDDEDEEEDEEEVTLDQVPAAVKAAILAEAQGGTIKEIERETEDGQTTYEAEIVINGKEIEIEIAPDGKVLEREADDDNDDDDDD
ncbi:MAG: PepSY-like domain-containing protein [Sedimentisphaerales bacterium]|nr:PepSY-like domain-containing protein [Sedimentisphaerales bacterium]